MSDGALSQNIVNPENAKKKCICHQHRKSNNYVSFSASHRFDSKILKQYFTRGYHISLATRRVFSYLYIDYKLLNQSYKILQ